MVSKRGQKQSLDILLNKLKDIRCVNAIAGLYLMTYKADFHNEFDCTVSDLMGGIGVSTKTAVSIIKSLRQVDLIRKVGKSRFMLNPYVFSMVAREDWNVLEYKWLELEPYDSKETYEVAPDDREAEVD